jgi:hypothetical protein
MIRTDRLTARLPACPSACLPACPLAGNRWYRTLKSLFTQWRERAVAGREASQKRVRRRMVRKTPLFEPFIYKYEHFTKTGSGQT